MDTAYYQKKGIKCLNQLIEKYALQFRIDDFGMGTEIFYQGKLVGYWFSYQNGIEFHCTTLFGGKTLHYPDWVSFTQGIEELLNAFNVKCGLFHGLDGNPSKIRLEPLNVNGKQGIIKLLLITNHSIANRMSYR